MLSLVVMKTHRLEPLLNPASIAIVGASNNAARIGGMPIAHLTKFGYQGQIFPINPKYEEVFGKRCYPDIESLPQAPDLVVLAIGAGDVTAMLKRCHARGVRAVIVEKDNAPKWNPSGLDEVTQEMVEKFFAPVWPDRAHPLRHL